MRKITVLDFANQIGVLSDEVPVIVKTDRKVIGRFRCLYEIPETAMPGVLEAKIDHVILRSDEITIQVKLKAESRPVTATRDMDELADEGQSSFASAKDLGARLAGPALHYAGGYRQHSENAAAEIQRGKSNERPQNISSCCFDISL